MDKDKRAIPRGQLGDLTPPQLVFPGAAFGKSASTELLGQEDLTPNHTFLAQPGTLSQYDLAA